MSAALTFCGRSEELQTIVERWQLASDPEKPSAQVVVVKAERGVGKTRLVLEFYRWLRKNVDKGCYWPALTVVDQNLAENPDLRDCKIKEQKIPYLWWGMRCADPGRENSIARDAIATYDQYLAPHLVALLIRENAQRTGKEVALLWAETFGDTLLTEAPELLHHAIPFFGLAVSVVKAGYRTKQLVDENIDRRDTDKALEKPRSRADRALEDLESAFNPKSSAFARTPGIIFIDDAQFASSDATLLSFAERLIHKAATQEWPMMIVATHWQAEFARELSNPKSFAGVIRHARTGGVQSVDPARPVGGGYLRPENYCDIDLRIVDDLSDALTGSLAGLSPAQIHAILERVGGNPRFLEQIIAFLREGNERLFEDYSVDKALTPEGLVTCLEETQDISKVVMRRLGRAPEEVQEALCLASMQGMQFSNSLAEDFARATISRSVRDPLAVAESPYSMVTGQGSADGRTVGEFAERLFFDAAVERRKNMKTLRDEATLVAALKNVLRSRIDDTTLIGKLGADDCALTYRLAANVLEKSDAVDKTRVLLAFAQLASLEESRHSLERALDAARQFHALFSTMPDVRESIPAWAFHHCVDVFRSVGKISEAQSLLGLILGYQRGRAERLDTPDALSDLAESLDISAFLADAIGKESAAAELYDQCLHIRRGLAELLNTSDALIALARSFSSAARKRAELGEYSLAAKLYAQALDIQRGLAASLQTPEALRELAWTLWSAGDLESDQRPGAAAAELYSQSLEILSGLAERLQTPEVMSDLARTLTSAGNLERARRNYSAAATFYAQGLAIHRSLVARLNTPEALWDLAETMNDMGVLAERGDNAAAAQICKEILDIPRDLAERPKTPEELRDLAVNLWGIAKVSTWNGDSTMAMTCWSEGQGIAARLPPHLGGLLIPMFGKFWEKSPQDMS